MNPKVTVIVASYNNSKFLPVCLDSLWQQTYADFEVLVVDDCSTDNSYEICQNYSRRDHRFRIIGLDKNHGITHVRSIGLKKASGEYLAVLDSDDVASPNRLANQVKWLDSHPDTVMIAGYYGVVDSDGKIIKHCKKVPVDDTSIRWWLTFGNCLIHSTVMYRREVALVCGGHDTSFVHGEDIELYSKLLTHGKIEAISEVVSYWRSHKKSYSKLIASEEREQDYLKVVKRSIQLQTGQKVNMDVAAAIFYNSKQPAKSHLVFRAGIDVLIHAFNHFYQVGEKSNFQKQILAKCFIKHLSRLRKRNRKQAWWKDGKKDWTRALKFLLFNRKYRWYFDRKLLANLKMIDLIHLLKISFIR
jgi:glycosyltransferase involved in cell wall biosynthesis